jgi:hypothetical protein
MQQERRQRINQKMDKVKIPSPVTEMVAQLDRTSRELLLLGLPEQGQQRTKDRSPKE